MPQGFVLRPRFFNIFINDLLYHVKHAKLSAFADVRAIDNFAYMIFSDMVGLDKSKKTHLAERDWDCFFSWLLAHDWLSYCRPIAILMQRENSAKFAINYTKQIIYLFLHHK